MITNSEMKEVDWPLTIAAGSILALGSSGLTLWPRRRYYTAILCGVLVSSIYMAAERYRVSGMGKQSFFEWTNAERPAGTDFFGTCKAGPRFEAVLNQVGEIVATSPRPIFFGPRMEFGYAVFGLTSPLHIPLWWHPGSSFAHRTRVGSLRHGDEMGFRPRLFKE